MQELWFLHFAHRLMLIDICKKLHENSFNSFQVIVLTQLRHNFVTDKVPKAITQKALMQVTVLELCMSPNIG